MQGRPDTFSGKNLVLLGKYPLLHNLHHKNKVAPGSLLCLHCELFYVTMHPVTLARKSPRSHEDRYSPNTVIPSQANVEVFDALMSPFAHASTSSPFHRCHLGVSPLPPAAV